MAALSSPAPAPDVTPEHPAARYDTRVRDVLGRAKLAIGALAVTMAADAWDFVARAWSIALIAPYADGHVLVPDELGPALDRADALVNLATYAGGAALLVTAVLYLRWLHAIVGVARGIGAGYLAWSPGAAVWSFFIPFVSLVRPYQVHRDLRENLDPREIIAPSLHADPRAAGDYRSAALVAPPPPTAQHRAPLGLWWALYLASAVGQRIVTSTSREGSLAAVLDGYRGQLVVDVLGIVAAALAMQVVRSLTARLGERFRRIRHTSPERLRDQQILVR